MTLSELFVATKLHIFFEISRQRRLFNLINVLMDTFSINSRPVIPAITVTRLLVTPVFDMSKPQFGEH